MQSTLKKNEILRGFRSFSAVLSSGECLKSGNVRCFFLLKIGEPRDLRAGFGVSRVIRKAATRNRLRRLMREAYRLNKGKFLARQSELSPGSIRVVFMYVPSAGESTMYQTYGSINRAITTLFGDLYRRLTSCQ